MNALYSVPPHPCRPDWGLFINQIPVQLVPMLVRQCRYSKCTNELRVPAGVYSSKVYCCPEHHKLSDQERARARHLASKKR